MNKIPHQVEENTGSNYIDGFVLPIARKYLDDYKEVAEQVADIWKEHGALAYFEYVGDDLQLEGTRSFLDAMEVGEDELVVFGWVVFESRSSRDIANQKVASDPRMEELIAPLVHPSKIIFDASQMLYAGFQPLICK